MDVRSFTRNGCRSRRHAHAFTLIELIVTLAVGAILIATAVPALHDLVMNQRITAEVNEFVAALHLARSHAIMRGERTVLCPTRDSAHCIDESVWSVGWMVFADANADRSRDPDERILRVHAPSAAGISITSGPGRRQIMYQPTGMASGTNTSLAFCDRRGPRAARTIVVSNTGRPRLAGKVGQGQPARCR